MTHGQMQAAGGVINPAKLYHVHETSSGDVRHEFAYNADEHAATLARGGLVLMPPHGANSPAARTSVANRDQFFVNWEYLTGGVLTEEKL